MKISLTDINDYPKTQKYEINVNILASQKSSDQKINTTPESKNYNKSDIKMKIQTITKDAQVILKFNGSALVKLFFK